MKNLTVPERPACKLFCIFIASTTANSCPSWTWSIRQEIQLNLEPETFLQTWAKRLRENGDVESLPKPHQLRFKWKGMSLHSDKFMALFTPVMIGQSNYFDIGCSTVIWNPLTYRISNANCNWHHCTRHWRLKKRWHILLHTKRVENMSSRNLNSSGLRWQQKYWDIYNEE